MRPQHRLLCCFALNFVSVLHSRTALMWVFANCFGLFNHVSFFYRRVLKHSQLEVRIHFLQFCSQTFSSVWLLLQEKKSPSVEDDEEDEGEMKVCLPWTFLCVFMRLSSLRDGVSTECRGYHCGAGQADAGRPVRQPEQKGEKEEEERGTHQCSVWIGSHCDQLNLNQTCSKWLS